MLRHWAKSKDSTFAIVTLVYHFNFKPNKRTNLELQALKFNIKKTKQILQFACSGV